MFIGVDVGGTKAHGVAFDQALAPISEITLPSGRGDRVIKQTRAVIAHLVREVGPATSAGIGIPGIVDARTGVVLHAANLGIDRLALGSAVADLTEGPVRVDNDMNAAALGASRVTGATESLAYVNVGTGLAAGLLFNGRLWRGEGGVVGEVGHLPYAAGGLTCPCGQIGCFETVASGAAIERDWNSTMPFDRAVADGDPRAETIYRRLVAGLCDAVQIIAATAGVHDIVLGGGVVNRLPRLLDDVRAESAQRAAASGFLRSLDVAARLRRLPTDAPVAALGAALLPITPSPADADTARTPQRSTIEREAP